MRPMGRHRGQHLHLVHSDALTGPPLPAHGIGEPPGPALWLVVSRRQVPSSSLDRGDPLESEIEGAAGILLGAGRLTAVCGHPDLGGSATACPWCQHDRATCSLQLGDVERACTLYRCAASEFIRVLATDTR